MTLRWSDNRDSQVFGRAFVDLDHGITEADIVEKEAELLERKRVEFAGQDFKVMGLVIQTVCEIYPPLVVQKAEDGTEFLGMDN